MLERPHAQKWQRDLEEIASYLHQRGISDSPRVAQLREFLQACIDDTSENSVLARFGPEYFVYAHEYVDFIGEHIRSQRSIDLNTLRRIFSGSFEFRQEELAGDDSRNLVLQIRAAAYLGQAGFHGGVTSSSDVVMMNRLNAYVVECKRLYSLTKCARRAREAAEQIEKGAGELFDKAAGSRTSGIGGIVWLDLTPMFLEFRTVIPTVDSSLARGYNIYSLRHVALPIVQLLSDIKYRRTKFVVAQGSAIFWNMQTGRMEHRLATYIRPTRHCSWLEGRRFRKAMSYLQGYERGPHLTTSEESAKATLQTTSNGNDAKTG